VQELDYFLIQRLGFAWWSVWFHFALILAVTACAQGNLKQFAPALLTLLGTLLALQMINTHDAAALNLYYNSTVCFCFLCERIVTTTGGPAATLVP
jgi:hypothetical protein